MKGLSSKIIYGKEEIPFDVLFVDRKSMEIAVHPDSRVVVKAPPGTVLEHIKTKLTKRARWIKRQQNYFHQFNPRTPARQYVGGETHLYLGRQFRLKIRKDKENQVKLVQGFFQITVDEDLTSDQVKRLLDMWYLEKARSWFHDILARRLPAFQRMGLPDPTLAIRRMKTRWGSLSPNGTLTLNVALIRAPRECIEYVITHELCHLKYQQHNAEFYRLLDQHMPDWEKRKHKLELALV